MYPEKLIYDIAGFPAVRGRDLIASLAQQAGRYGPRYLLGEEAQSVAYDDPDSGRHGDVRAARQGWLHRGERRDRHIHAAPLDALDRFEGRGLAYFVPRPQEYQGRDVVIVGGGDSAFDWALTLAPLARSVTIVHRRETFRAHEALVRQVLGWASP